VSALVAGAVPDIPVVYIVDDDVSVCESLEALLPTAGCRVESFKSAREFFARTRPPVPQCLIFDVVLPDASGLELQTRLLASGACAAPVIFITGYGDVRMSVSAMKQGAVEFLTKPLEAETVLDAVQQALKKSRELMAQKAAGSALLARYQTLTSREREVMQCIVHGLLNKQAAAKLHISEVTVKAHRGRLLRKMGTRSLAALVSMAATLEGCL
jgi:FixJ family two-component response regulator